MDARTKKLTDTNYSPTIPDSEEAIRSQIDGSIQEVYDIVDEAKLDKTSGDYTGSWHGITKPVYAEPGLAGVVDAHLAEHSYLQEEEPTNVNPTTLWFAIGSEVNFSGGGVAIQNAETSDTPPETNIWFKPI